MSRACRQFSRLVGEAKDRNLSKREDAFVARHRETCPQCAELESELNASLFALRLSRLEPEASPGFQRRTERLVKNQATAESMRYWSPALVGAAIASIAMLAVIQLVTRSTSLPQLRVPGAEARRIEPKIEPALRLERQSAFDDSVRNR